MKILLASVLLVCATIVACTRIGFIPLIEDQSMATYVAKTDLQILAIGVLASYLARKNEPLRQSTTGFDTTLPAVIDLYIASKNFKVLFEPVMKEIEWLLNFSNIPNGFRFISASNAIKPELAALTQKVTEIKTTMSKLSTTVALNTNAVNELWSLTERLKALSTSFEKFRDSLAKMANYEVRYEMVDGVLKKLPLYSSMTTPLLLMPITKNLDKLLTDLQIRHDVVLNNIKIVENSVASNSALPNIAGTNDMHRLRNSFNHFVSIYEMHEVMIRGNFELIFEILSITRLLDTAQAETIDSKLKQLSQRLSLCVHLEKPKYSDENATYADQVKDVMGSFMTQLDTCKTIADELLVFANCLPRYDSKSSSANVEYGHHEFDQIYSQFIKLNSDLEMLRSHSWLHFVHQYRVNINTADHANEGKNRQDFISLILKIQDEAALLSATISAFAAVRRADASLPAIQTMLIDLVDIFGMFPIAIDPSYQNYYPTGVDGVGDWDKLKTIYKLDSKSTTISTAIKSYYYAPRVPKVSWNNFPYTKQVLITMEESALKSAEAFEAYISEHMTKLDAAFASILGKRAPQLILTESATRELFEMADLYTHIPATIPIKEYMKKTAAMYGNANDKLWVRMKLLKPEWTELAVTEIEKVFRRSPEPSSLLRDEKLIRSTFDELTNWVVVEPINKNKNKTSVLELPDEKPITPTKPFEPLPTRSPNEHTPSEPQHPSPIHTTDENEPIDTPISPPKSPQQNDPIPDPVTPTTEDPIHPTEDSITKKDPPTGTDPKKNDPVTDANKPKDPPKPKELEKKSTSILMIGGVIGAIVIVMAGVGGGFFYIRHKRSSTPITPKTYV